MVEWFVRLHKPVLIGVAAVTALSAALLFTRGLKKDYSLEAFVASSSDSYSTFRRLMDEFVSNEFAVIAIQSDDAESEATLGLVGELVADVRSLEAVQRVTSLADILSGLPAFVRNFVSPRVREHPLLVDNLISRDGKTTAILLQMAGEGATGAARKHTVARLKEIVAAARQKHPTNKIILAGPYVTLIDMYDYVDRDLLNFSAAGLALLLLTLGLVFRRLAPMLFALFVSIAATLCTVGMASALALPSTLIMQMIVILVMVLSVANCVHLIVADDEVFARAPFYEWDERARRVLKRMAAPCAAVIMTTAVGFGSVCISSITPVRMFGLLMVVGLLWSLAVSLFAIVLLARARPPAAQAPAAETLPALLRAVGLWVNAHRRQVFIGFAVASVVSAIPLGRLRFESDFVKNFRSESEVRRSYEFIESHLSPTGSVEVVVRRIDGDPIVSPESISRLRQAGDRAVLDFDPVKKALTLADMLTLGPGPTPSTAVEIDARLALARRLFGAEALRNFLNSDATALRMNLRVREGLPVQQKLQLADDIGELTAEILGPEYRMEVTGLYVFYATLVAELWQDQFRSLGLTVPAVFVVLVLVLRSVKVALIAMIPTTVPVLFCLGAMGWTGIPVNMTTAMMLSVILGIAVDDALHYLWRFRDALNETGDYTLALKRAHGSVGRACVFTTVVIAGGFWILTLSQFLPTAYFGGLLAFTMCGALAADLILLPALVLTFKPFPTNALA